MYHTLVELQAYPQQTFAFIKTRQEGHTFHVTLNRPDKKNALHPLMVNELAYALGYAAQETSIWVVVLSAEGNTFCAGADLRAFAGDQQELHSSIPPAHTEPLMGELFNLLHKPSIAHVQGNAYAGAFLLLAACTYVVAHEDVRFGLPEAKRGIFPFQVMASLMEIMPARQLIDWCIRAYELPAAEAQQHGLVTHVCKGHDEAQSIINQLITDISASSPNAIHLGMEAYDHLRRAQRTQHHYLREMLAKTLAHQDFKEGMEAFKEKRAPNWEH